MDFTENSCRLCLNLTSEDNLSPLFENCGKAEDSTLEWRRMFSFIYDIQRLPDKICNNCKAQAEWMLNFHRQCYDNDLILRLNQMKIVDPEFSEQDNGLSNTNESYIPSSDQFCGTEVYEYNTKDFEKHEDQILQIIMEEEDPEIIDPGNNNSNEQENIAEESITFFQGDESKTFEEKDQLNDDHKMDYSNQDASNKQINNNEGSAMSGGSSPPKSGYTCPICGKSFKHSSNMIVHRKKHGNPKPFDCTIPGCNKKFSNKMNRNDHIKTIHERCTYKCPACNHKQKYRVDVAKHINKLHRGSDLQPIELKS